MERCSQFSDRVTDPVSARHRPECAKFDTSAVVTVVDSSPVELGASRAMPLRIRGPLRDRRLLNNPSCIICSVISVDLVRIRGRLPPTHGDRSLHERSHGWWLIVPIWILRE